MKRPARLMLNSIISLLIFWLASGIAVAQELPPPQEWIPEDAVVVLEIPDSSKIVKALLSEDLPQVFEENPQVKQFLQSPQFAQFAAIVRYLEFRLGTDWKDAVRKLFGGSLTLALFPRDRALLIVDTKSAELLAKLHQVLLEHAREEAQRMGDPDRVASGIYKGWTGWTLDGGKSVYALVGSRLLLANRAEVLRSVADVAEAGGGGSLARLATYRESHAVLPPEAWARLFVNMERITQSPQGERLGRATSSNPLVALLVADNLQALTNASWLAGAVTVQGNRVALRVACNGNFPAGDHPTAFSLPTDETGCLANIEVPRRLVALSLYRDLARFYQQKDTLFPERTSGLIFFENMMGVFFTGRHFSEEVLTHLHPEIRLVLAAQDYEPEYGVPSVALPALAVVFRMKDPKQFVPMAEEAWQKALGLINFTRGQQALPGLILDRAEYQGVRYSVAAFSTAGLTEEERKDIRFNFRPVLAPVGEYLVLSSTEQLARDIIDALRKEDPRRARLPGRHFVLETNREGLLRLAQANREALIRQNMVEQGHDRQRAETDINNLLALISLLGELRLELLRQNGKPQAEVAVALPIGGR